MTNLFKAAHKMAKEIKTIYPEVNYKFQFALCLKYLKTVKEEVTLNKLQGSEKQIVWAEKIRAFVSNSILTALTQIENKEIGNEKIDGFTEIQIELAEKLRIDLQNDSAKWWIETFGFNCVNTKGHDDIVNFLQKKCWEDNSKYDMIRKVGSVIARNNGTNIKVSLFDIK